ncbi:MAG: hydrogenase expression/formation protein HypE [Candidatus Lokiarchaeota archaeon]|nr:hydrogenase expression/formation protein HypE [Candidatus Harpocratesius repetitus]
MEKHKLDEIVQLGHGGGGIMQDHLIHFITDRILIKKIGNGIGVDSYDDGATIPLENSDEEIVITADGHTVEPLFFPGGDLGSLSVAGTVNDLLMMGARPLAITSTIFIEEGTEFRLLDKIIKSFNQTAKQANVAIIAGDTKVLPKGALKDVIIATTGIGIKPKNRRIFDANCKPGSKIILTGSIGDHGAALIAQRQNFALETPLESDERCLIDLLPIIETTSGIQAMKDPTRGGLAAALNEWAHKSNVSIWIEQNKIPVKREVQSIADILGLEPLEIANEGKAILCVEAEYAEEVLTKLQQITSGRDAVLIGEVKAEKPDMVIMETPLGGKRIVEKPMGELIPRIC